MSGVQIICSARGCTQALFSGAAPLMLSTFHWQHVNRSLWESPVYSRAGWGCSIRSSTACRNQKVLERPRKNGREQEVNEATEGTCAPSVTSFTSCSLPVWVSPLATGMTACICFSSSFMLWLATYQPSLLPWVQGISAPALLHVTDWCSHFTRPSRKKWQQWLH